MAIPARRSPFPVTSDDGTTTNVVLLGDENFHYYVSEVDGTLLMRAGDSFILAEIDTAGRLVPTSHKVKASSLSAEETRGRSPRQRVVPGVVEGTTFPQKGKQKAVVVLVEYRDVKFNLANPLDYFTRMLNQEGFSDWYATGSARDWFLHSSAGQFEPEFDVFGPVTLQKNQEYYGGNDAFGQDNAPQKMVIEACRQLNATVDFSQYDRDQDGFIDNVFVVYAGRGEASGGGDDCVWPHAWTISYAEPGQRYIFDGVRLDRYACCNEWELSAIGHGYRPVGIGTFVHEFSHVMGLPDLYSTSYTAGTFTPGAWSVMDYGPYNNDGDTPPQYSAWERASLGYLTPDALPDRGNLAIPPLDNNAAYMIKTRRPEEFFIIENRRQAGWDEFIPGHGMLVWHIDYNPEKWSANEANNDPTHSRIDIVEADGTQTEESRDGDSFPGAAGVTSLSSSTTPALKTWNGEDTGVSLTDISEFTDRLVARVNGGAPDIAAPEIREATGITAGAFTANWNQVDGALAYFLSVEDSDGQPIANLTVEQPGCLVDGLTPSSHYSYTVRADDGFYGSLPSERAYLRTLDPTLDYLSPVSLDAEDVTDDSFTACWEQMAGATQYFLTVEREYEGEPEEFNFGFDNGADDLPDGWTTTSAGSYGMAAYSGELPPSLRLSADRDELKIAIPAGMRVESLSFWHRGNQTSANETITLSRLSDGEWEEVTSWPVTTDKGGTILRFQNEKIHADAFSLRFNRNDKGAVAIDDIRIIFAGPLLTDLLPDYDRRPAGDRTRMTVDNLSPETTYYYTVHASDGEFLSLPSSRTKVTTYAKSLVRETVNPANASRMTIDGRTIRHSSPFDVYDMTGRPIARRVTTLTLPHGGFYIVVADDIRAMKVAVD